ncbi:hypothetical protein PR202_ga21464 [Eleusine coracana subsp. coracana]|uniref:Uncharacterized protein n=1 Tax=Eleusine coracana subsp. coracana TaxID=191504 RepID=A0AAV5D0P9_ELECO|nr:hypothetical protein PR202_ga21464 [Eleusine coracana subsp. coracana]
MPSGAWITSDKRKRFEARKAKHHSYMRDTHDGTHSLNRFKIGLASIFESLTAVSSERMQTNYMKPPTQDSAKDSKEATEKWPAWPNTSKWKPAFTSSLTQQGPLTFPPPTLSIPHAHLNYQKSRTPLPPPPPLAAAVDRCCTLDRHTLRRPPLHQSRRPFALTLASEQTGPPTPGTTCASGNLTGARDSPDTRRARAANFTLAASLVA